MFCTLDCSWLVSSPPKSEELMLHVLQHNNNSVSSLKPTSLWILAALFFPAVAIITLSRFTLQPSIFQEIKDMASITTLCQTYRLYTYEKCTYLVSLLKMLSMFSCCILCIRNFINDMQNNIFPMLMWLFHVLLYL